MMRAIKYKNKERVLVVADNGCRDVGLITGILRVLSNGLVYFFSGDHVIEEGILATPNKLTPNTYYYSINLIDKDGTVFHAILVPESKLRKLPKLVTYVHG